MKDISEKRTMWLWSALLFFLLLSLTCLALVLFPIQPSNAEAIPIALHSELSANYNADPPSTPIPNLQLDIIEDIIHSEVTSASEVPERLSTIENIFKTPVPTITPIPTQIIFITSLPQPGPITPLPTQVLSTPTRTPPPPTRTRQPNPTKQPRPTKQPQPTKQPRPTKQPKPTKQPGSTKQPQPTQNLPLSTSTPKHSKKPTPTNVLPTVTILLRQPTSTIVGFPYRTSTPVNQTEIPQSTATPLPTLPIIIPSLTPPPLPTLPIIIPPLTPTPLPTLPLILPTQNLFGPL